jgi:hypothetical protein
MTVNVLTYHHLHDGTAKRIAPVGTLVKVTDHEKGLMAFRGKIEDYGDENIIIRRDGFDTLHEYCHNKVLDGRVIITKL